MDLLTEFPVIFMGGMWVLVFLKEMIQIIGGRGDHGGRLAQLAASADDGAGSGPALARGRQPLTDWSIYSRGRWSQESPELADLCNCRNDQTTQRPAPRLSPGRAFSDSRRFGPSAFNSLVRFYHPVPSSQADRVGKHTAKLFKAMPYGSV